MYFRSFSILYFLLLIVTGSFSQKIGNIRAEQDGNNIVIHYDIINLSGAETFDISLYLSIDEAEFTGPLRSVSGDVGMNVAAGRNKKITWYVLEERESLKSNSVEFKVMARTYNAKIIEMVFVEGGEFVQGSLKEDDEKPMHTTYVNDFFIGKFEITQRQWKIIMGSNPSFFDYCEECPVENVSWKDVESFIQMLNAETGMNYRLPTESEWEYAAKGGNKSMDYVFSGGDNPDEVGWYKGNNKQQTRKPGLKKPNELGIFDMSGNVMEWCNDWYSQSYYNQSPYKNPTGPPGGIHKVIRGGSWNTGKMDIRAANRSYASRGGKYDDLGFRLARDAD